MSSIQKRQHANGQITYRARIRVAGMPDKSATFATRSQAKLWAQKMEADIRQGRYFPKQEDKERTVGELVDRYIEKELPKKPKSLTKQRNQLLWWKKQLGAYFLCHLSPSLIAELRDQLLNEITVRGKLRSSSTTNRYLAALSQAFTIAIKEWGWLRENPVLKITRPKEGKARECYLEKDNIVRLLEECQKSKSPYLYAIVVFALATGARRGEILNLKWQDIDFKKCIATFHDTKNGETRSVSLSQTVINCLRQERGRRVVLSPYVFPNQEGTGPADIRTAWDNIVEKLNLKGVRFHDLRHTAASHLAMNGASTLEIAAILGHKTLAMVKRYSHLSTSSTAHVLNRMNNEILGECRQACS